MKKVTPGTVLITIYVTVILGALAAIFASSVPNTPTIVSQPDVVMEVLDPTLKPYERLWAAEIGRRFHNAVGVFCHGGNHLALTWDTSVASYGHVVTIQDVVRYEQARYPDRTIVLISCNPGHLKLGIPNVYYAPDNIWLEPDRDAMGEEDAAIRVSTYPNYVGSIFEFIKD